MTYSHTFMHAEPVDLLFSLFCILSNTFAFTVPHAANTINTFSANPFHSKTYHHTYKSTRKTENYWKVLRFQSGNWNKYTYCTARERERGRERERERERERGTSNCATVFHHSMQPQNWDFIS